MRKKNLAFSLLKHKDVLDISVTLCSAGSSCRDAERKGPILEPMLE